ncbi:MAG: hypothetical protein KKA16_01390 [Alphaproteobacteria bacterium]|nr:hypothetical protein [Alphaproteobacteria bacterium]MBU2379532.1 hypothetical protein [Alphaproteobacteria bacterium]
MAKLGGSRSAGNQFGLTEPSRLNHVRISIPVRMKMRGGRTWLEDRDAAAGRKAKAARLDAIKRLRAAHDAFKPSRPALARQLTRVRSAQVPLRKVEKLGWVFLAPGIQSAILNGRLDPSTISRLKRQASIPLSWAAQRRLLEPNGSAATPHA